MNISVRFQCSRSSFQKNDLLHEKSLKGLLNGHDSIHRFPEAAAVADPLFSGRAPLPYAPKALSPCINSGADVGWTSADTDLAGNKRRCGAVVDMGCYEYRSTGLQFILQ